MILLSFKPHLAYHKMRLAITSLIALFLLAGCGNNELDDSEMFVGSYRIMDQMVPYPYIFKQKKDSVFLYNNTGMILDKIEKKAEDTIDFKFKTHHLKILRKTKSGFLAYDSLDTINFKPLKNNGITFKDVARFEKISGTKELDISQIRKEIGNSIWKYDVVEDENNNPNEDLDIGQLFHFKNDSLTVITQYFYHGQNTVSEHETKAYFIFEIDSNYFLSFQKEVDNPQPIYQIIGYDGDEIELKDFSSRDVKNISFYKDPIRIKDFTDLIENTTQFSNCFDGYQGEYYFGNDVTFKKGNEFIIDYVNIDASQNDTKSGYLIIHFNINCKGDVGKFGLIQMDKAFKKTTFTKEIVNHLLNKVSELKDFPSSKSNVEWLNYKDVHGFLMFKLENGKIVDLCP